MQDGNLIRGIYQADSRPTLAQLGQARPYRPAGPPENAEAHTQRTLDCLEAAKSRGCTTTELMDQGCGLRPPNRICDLRHKRGIPITTRPEGRGVYRYILTKYITPAPAPLADWQDRPRVTGLPLFDLAMHP